MFYVFFFAFFVSLTSLADLSIPSSLSNSDQQRATKILGFSSASKLLGDPFPLGGYSGLEIGLSYELIPTAEIATLGSKAAVSSEVGFASLVVGKGLYNNLDFFLQVSPFRQNENLTNYGGQLRWGFYQAEYIPAYISAVVSVNTVNFQNKIILTNQTYDLIAGFNVQDITLYAGLGGVRSMGTFMGGASGVTASGSEASVSVTDSHYVAGMNLRHSSAFISLQFDRYIEATYSLKLGFRL